MKRRGLPGNGLSVKTHDTIGAARNAPLQLLYSRAFEAVIWGMPAVNFERMCQTFIHDANGSMNEVVYWSRTSDWKNQTLMPNSDFIFFMPFFDTKHVGPMILEIPAYANGIIAGTIHDCWQNMLAQIGEDGKSGNRERYLILPPDYNGSTPVDYIAVKSNYYQGYALLRSVLKSNSMDDVAAAVSFARQIRLYPLSKAGNPPPTIFEDAADIIFDATIQYDLRFFQALNRIVQYEPWVSRDKVMIDILKTIGIEKGRLFKPNLRTQEILDEAAHDVREWFRTNFESLFFPCYEGRQWMTFPPTETVEGDSGFENNDFYAVGHRGFLFSYALSTATQLSPEYFCLIAIRDKVAEPLNGSNEYRLQVPDCSALCEYWSVTLYDRDTHSLIRDVRRVSQSSRNPELQKRSNGTIDIFFSPLPPKEKASNWIPTLPKTNIEVCIRFYAPGKELLDKKWKVPDVERIG